MNRFWKLSGFWVGYLRSIKNRILRHARNRTFPPNLLPTVSFGDLFALCAAAKQTQLNVLQIGGFDGKSFDPIFHVASRIDVKMTIIEPIPEYARMIKENYGEKPDLEVINAALLDASSAGEIPIYRFTQPIVEKYPNFGATSSLSRQHLVAAFKRNRKLFPANWSAEDFIVEQSVQSISVAELSGRLDLFEVDVVVVDVEGGDWRLLDSLLGLGPRPALIYFESRFLDISEFEQCLMTLNSLGYAVIDFGLDTCAIFSPSYVGNHGPVARNL